MAKSPYNVVAVVDNEHLQDFARYSDAHGIIWKHYPPAKLKVDDGLQGTLPLSGVTSPAKEFATAHKEMPKGERLVLETIDTSPLGNAHVDDFKVTFKTFGYKPNSYSNAVSRLKEKGLIREVALRVYERVPPQR